MIREVTASIFTAPEQTLVNPVNCVGTTGAGLARQFRDRYPFMYAQYAALCESGEMKTGATHLCRGGDRWVILFPTKAHWRDRSRLEFIERGLRHMVRQIRDDHDECIITSLALPRLGCGLGGLSWSDVRPLIVRHLGELPIPVTVYHPEA